MRSASLRSKRLVALVLLSVSLFLQGCSYNAWYTGFQQRQRQECYERGNSAEVQSCLEKANLSYEQYKSSREEVLKK